MPVFNRAQQSHWSADDYVTVDADGVSSPTGSQHCRVPRPGLRARRLHAGPGSEHVRSPDSSTQLTLCYRAQSRHEMLLLYYGFSTGGAYLWPLAKRLSPDGIAGYGMSNFPISYYSSRAVKGQLRLALRPLGDAVCASAARATSNSSTAISAKTSAPRRGSGRAHAPRFKSFEDTFMFFNVAALSETVSRLWNAPVPAGRRFATADLPR